MTKNTLLTDRSIRVFDLVVNISGPLEGTIDDWPPEIQDGIHAALERKSIEVGCPLAIVSSRVGHDAPEEPWYVVVTASEVVAAIPATSLPPTSHSVH